MSNFQMTLTYERTALAEIKHSSLYQRIHALCDVRENIAWF